MAQGWHGSGVGWEPGEAWAALGLLGPVEQIPKFSWMLLGAGTGGTDPTFPWVQQGMGIEGNWPQIPSDAAGNQGEQSGTGPKFPGMLLGTSGNRRNWPQVPSDAAGSQ